MLLQPTTSLPRWSKRALARAARLGATAERKACAAVVDAGAVVVSVAAAVQCFAAAAAVASHSVRQSARGGR